MATKALNKQKQKKKCSTNINSVPLIPGMTSSQVAEWIRELENAKDSCSHGFKDTPQHQYDEDQDSFEDVDFVDEPNPMSNVSFWPGNTAQNSTVIVGGAEITGVVKAVLEYDADTDVPILKLEIMGPRIR
jgi:hypothetical protein